jgi:superfamily II DNA or RNA helicase
MKPNSITLYEGAIIVGSIGCMSTGVNIPNLDNIIFATPSKSRIRTLQSIGRVLRIGRSDKATLYDIVDDMQYKKHRNFVLKHFIERAKIYDAEDFDYNIYQIPL